MPANSTSTVAGRRRTPAFAAPAAFVSLVSLRYGRSVPQRWPPPPWSLDPLDVLPDVRDGLTRLERVVLTVLHETQRERGGRNVPTAMLYGRVVERIPVSVDELQRVLQRLGATQHGAAVDPARLRAGAAEGAGRSHDDGPASARRTEGDER